MNTSHYLKNELYGLMKTDDSIFEFLQDSSCDGIWYWDLEQPEQEWMSPKFWSVLGYDYQMMPNSPSAWMDIIHPDDLKLANEQFIAHCEDPESLYDQTVRYRHKNGSTVWIRCRGLAIRDKDGKPIRMLGSHQNITEFVKKTQHLDKSIDLLNFTQKISGIGSWELDLETNEVFWTEELYHMYGFDPKLPPPPYTEHMKLFTPESWELLASSLALTQEKGIPYELELTTIREDGSNGYMWVRGEADFNEQGKITHIKGLAQDITSKKIAEQQKDELTKRLNYALDATGDGIWDWSIPSGETIYSRPWLEMLGYQQEEVASIEMEWAKKLHPEDAERVLREVNKVIASPKFGDSFTHEYRFKNKQGQYVWILNRGKVVERNEEGAGIRLVGAHTDISNLKQKEEVIKLNETRLSLATKAGGVGIWDWDIVSDKLTWDDQMFTLYGVDKNQFSSAYEAWVQGVYELDKKRGDEEIQMAIRGEKDFNTEFRVQYADGEIKYIKALATVLRDEKGNAIRMIGTNWDITAEKETLAQIAAVEEAEKANKAKSEFLANMSHEIRTPLNSVIGFTDLLKKTNLSPTQQQYVNSANVAGHALLGLINDILDFSKIEAGMLDLDIIKSDMIQLFEDSIDLVKFAASEKNIELLLDMDPNMPRFAYVDAIRLKQILSNLLGNAVKFTLEGEVELKVRYQEVDGGKGKVAISVRDTGIGIPKDHQNKLFKSFSQADSSTTRKFGGTGLGLVISQLIAEKMNTRIQIESKVGKGSTFFFDVITDFENGDKSDQKSIKGIQTCLIIDDNLNNQTIMKQMLENWQIASECCNSGYEAFQIIDSSPPFDLIICDYDMPYINGIETIRMLKNKLLLSLEKQPIILLHSSLDNLKLEKECQELGIRFHLSKPVKSSDLYNYLNNLHEQKALKMVKEMREVTESDTGKEGLKILVAEDVFLNMVLIKAMLSELDSSIQVIEAKDGNEAVEKYQKMNPDLIFMDVHMPDLDGIQATKKIRQIESFTGHSIPIVALTAGALKEEREKCFESGMNDFLTKPLVPEKIKGMLDKYLEEKKSKPRRKEEPKDDTNLPVEYSELLSLFKSKSIIKEALSLALEDLPAAIQKLELAYQQKDLVKIHKAAHLIRGSSSSLRFGLMAKIAEEIEKSAKNEDMDGLNGYLAELKKEWERVRLFIQEKIKEI